MRRHPWYGSPVFEVPTQHVREGHLVQRTSMPCFAIDRRLFAHSTCPHALAGGNSSRQLSMPAHQTWRPHRQFLLFLPGGQKCRWPLSLRCLLACPHIALRVSRRARACCHGRDRCVAFDVDAGHEFKAYLCLGGRDATTEHATLAGGYASGDRAHVSHSCWHGSRSEAALCAQRTACPSPRAT